MWTQLETSYKIDDYALIVAQINRYHIQVPTSLQDSSASMRHSRHVSFPSVPPPVCGDHSSSTSAHDYNPRSLPHFVLQMELFRTPHYKSFCVCTNGTYTVINVATVVGAILHVTVKVQRVRLMIILVNQRTRQVVTIVASTGL